MKIIKYENTANITIEFQDLHKVKRRTTYQNFKNKDIKNPYDRFVFNVGYLGEGNYKTTGKHKGNKFADNVYTVWRNMIERCYSEKFRDKHLSYENCYVSDVWHSFENFAEWYYANYYNVGTERMHLDKDILYKNNKFYSSETCLIVPQRINMLFLNKSNTTGYPHGILKTKNQYGATYNTKYLGLYNTIQDAMIAYNEEKKNHIRQVADEYKEVIPLKVYKALYNWIPDECKIA